MTVADVFARCRRERRAALIPYLMAGDPSPELTPSLLVAAAAGGADIIELGLPYSDPLADGPTIQGAAQRALRAGTTFEDVLRAVGALDRTAVQAPIIAFTYYNPLYVRGLAKTAKELAAAGFAGAIIPDLPPEEAEPAEAAFAEAGIGLTFLVAPTTPIERVAAIAPRSSGFVYVVSRMGVTGAGKTLAADVERLVMRLRSVVDKPLAVGFGISTPAHASTIGSFADGVVIGSALIDRLAAAPPRKEEAAVREYCSSLAAALRWH